MTHVEECHRVWFRMKAWFVRNHTQITDMAGYHPTPICMYGWLEDRQTGLNVEHVCFFIFRSAEWNTNTTTVRTNNIQDSVNQYVWIHTDTRIWYLYLPLRVLYIAKSRDPGARDKRLEDESVILVHDSWFPLFMNPERWCCFFCRPREVRRGLRIHTP